MSRLLFAAARGARVQSHNGASWNNDPYAPVGTHPDHIDCRIHPDDIHLQYGPISTALREAALAQALPRLTLAVRGNYGIWAAYIADYLPYKECDDELHRSLFLLILAEALADEGL